MHLRRQSGVGLASALVFSFGFVLASSNAALAVTHWVNDDDPNGSGYSPPGTSCSDPGYQNIGDAVTPAVSGDTIMVCPGTYIENVVLAESLTLLGAQAGVQACGRAASESIVIPLMPANGTLELRSGSAGSIINGFTFSGGTGLGSIRSTSGPINDLQLLNNRIRAFTGNGVFLNDIGTNITANQNEIDGTVKVGGGGLFHLDTDNFDGFHFTNNCVVNGMMGTGFFVDGNRNVGPSSLRAPLFSGNFIDNNGTGANLGRFAWEAGPITGNTFSNNRFDGLQGGPKDALITKNTFDSNGRDGLALTGFGGVTDPSRGAQNNDIVQNCFTQNGFGVAGNGIFFTTGQFPGTISTNEAHQNNIFGNLAGARYDGNETIDATNNWWGHPTGPRHLATNPTGMGDVVISPGNPPNGIHFDPWLRSPAVGTPCILPPGDEEDEEAEDDDDFDQDGERDDEDEDDDNDGLGDDEDGDDDNDGLRDGEDEDDDNDKIHDEFDSESSRERQRSSNGRVAGGQHTDYTMAADAATLLLIGLVEAPNAEGLRVEIYDPVGRLVAISLPTPGRALATVPAPSPGIYTMRVRSTGDAPIDYIARRIKSMPWF